MKDAKYSCEIMQEEIKNKYISPEIKYAFDASIKALEKQVPKPPENKVHEKYPDLGRNYYCECGVMFFDYEKSGTNYCGNCGQRLK